MSVAREIEGYPDYYVSSAGNVWRRHKNESFMKLRPNKRGLVNLSTNGERKHMLVYRLVAIAFVPIPEQYQGMSIDELEVHHADFNHSNNLASNLMWLTKAEHMKLHSESDVTSLRKSETHKGKRQSEETKQKISEALKGKQINRSDQSKVVIEYTENGEFVAEYASAHEASRQTKVNQGHICECCKGKRKSAGGFLWKYA